MTHPNTQSQLTCQSCPFFDDYHDQKGRGWCRAFDKSARRHHLKTPECELVIQDHTVMVELHTKAIEDDGFGHPVPVDSRMLSVTVLELTQEAVEAALPDSFDSAEWTVGRFWKPEPNSEF
ncbi:MAG: hypothetical protein AB4426_26260 [Xenococcaceae cyanobacterium]